MAQTANYGFEKPSTDKNVDEEFYQLQETLDLLDAILAALQTAVNGKSAVGHTHAISDVVNLAAELAAKMPANQTFKLDDLTDVDGADGAPNGYVLVKSALGWLPSSALAALGTHGHLISEITGLVDALDTKVSFTEAQSRTEPEKAQARDNIGFTPALVAYNRWKTIADEDFGGVSQSIFANLGDYSRLRLEGYFRATDVSQALYMQGSANNGVSFFGGALDYEILFSGISGGVDLSGSNLFTSAVLCNTTPVGAAWGGDFHYSMGCFNEAREKYMSGSNMYISSLPATTDLKTGTRFLSASAVALNALRLFPSGGTAMNGHIYIEGLPG